VEFIPLFFVVGLALGGMRVAGPVVAVGAAVVFWTWLWISTGGDLYGDGVIGLEFWLVVMVASALFALLGVGAHRRLRRLIAH
jgi:hypothetical protein